jgi:hypothetical protein
VSEITEDRARPPVPGSRDLVGEVLPGEAATLRAAQEALDGRHTG